VFCCIKKSLREGIQVKTKKIRSNSLRGMTIRVKTCSAVKMESRCKEREKLRDCVRLH
jgi:hypothetical protein